MKLILRKAKVLRYLLILLFFLLLLSGSFYIFILKDPLRFFVNDESFYRDNASEYNLGDESQNFLLACLIDYRNEELWCYSKKSEEFQRASFFENEIQSDNYQRGFILLEIDRNEIKEYSVDTDALFDKWYQQISDNEDFFFPIDSSVNLYDFLSWKIIQYRKSDITKEEIKRELQSLKDDRYIIESPAKASDLEIVFEEGSEEYQYWYKYRELPAYVLDKFNSQESEIFGDPRRSIVLLSNYVRGMKSLNSADLEESELVEKYQEFEKRFKTFHSDVSSEEIVFRGEFVPLGLVDFNSEIYDSWERNDRDGYYYFLDIYNNDTNNYIFELKILYEEYGF